MLRRRIWHESSVKSDSWGQAVIEADSLYQSIQIPYEKQKSLLTVPSSMQLSPAAVQI